jgi:multidrug efflux pump
MNFTSFFVKNPVYAIVLNVMLIVIGILSFNSLHVREYPKVDIPRITVSVMYQNASPEVIESAVTTPLEDELAGVESIERITSDSCYEYSRVNLRFREGTSMDKAIAFVRDAISRLRDRLPRDVGEPKIFRDTGQNNGMQLVLLSVESEKMNSLELSHFTECTIKNVFRSIDGVSSVEIWGDCRMAKISLDPRKMYMFGINADEVYKAINEETILRPVGKVRDVTPASMKSKLEDLEDFHRIVLKHRLDSKLSKRHIIFLKDVADIEFSTDDRSSRSYINGKKATLIAINAASDANPVEVSDRIQQEIEKLRNEMTADIKISTIMDRAEFVRNSIKNAENAAFEAIILVLLIVFLFLRSVRATFIPIITIPISLIGAIVFLKACEFSINIMTLLAMVLAVGLVVDDAIVVLENVSRHIKNGVPKLEAALRGSSEISMAIIAMTFTLVSVYAPFAFIQGIIGQLFIEFAIALAGSVLISGFVALTLSPLMCSVLLTQKDEQSRFFPQFDVIFYNFTGKYQIFLERTMRRKTLTFAIALASLIASVTFLKILPQETVHREDRGLLMASISYVSGKNADYYEEQTMKVASFFEKVPELKHCLAFANPENGFVMASLVPKTERKKLADEIASDLREKMQDFPSQDIWVWSEDSNLPGISNLQGSSYIGVVISTSGTYQDLYKNLEKARVEFQKNPLFENPGHDLNLNSLAYKICIDHDKAPRLGISKGQIANTLEIFFSGNRNLYGEKDGIRYPIVIESTEKPYNLSGIYVTNDAGRRISLDVVAKMIPSTEPTQYFHYNQMRSAYLWFGVPKGQNFKEVLTAGMKILNETLPQSYRKTPQGEAEQAGKSAHTMLLLFALAIVFIFAILSLQFNNFRDPLIILLTAPLACCGALFGIWLVGISLNIYTSVGLITLVGLITKHGIMIVEFANQLISQGESIITAVHRAASIRLRPILMTTGAMFFGSIPLVLSSDYGFESRQSIGVILTCGLFFGTIFVITIFPGLCAFFKRPLKRPFKGEVQWSDG